MTRPSILRAQARLVLVAVALAALALATAGRAATEGESRLTALREGTHATDLVAGGGGSIWFVGFRANGEDVVGRIGSDGTVSEFPLGPSNGFGGAIAAAPDGSFWFTETGAGMVGRITPGGAI